MSLRGKSAAVEDKREISEKARRERTKRAREREENDASTSIQRAYRRWARCKTIALAECGVWDRRTADLDKLARLMAAQGKAFNPPAKVTVELVRMVVWFSYYLRPVEAAGRLTRACALLASSSKSDSILTNVCSLLRETGSAALLSGQV